MRNYTISLLQILLYAILVSNWVPANAQMTSRFYSTDLEQPYVTLPLWTYELISESRMVSLGDSGNFVRQHLFHGIPKEFLSRNSDVQLYIMRNEYESRNFVRIP